LSSSLVPLLLLVLLLLLLLLLLLVLMPWRRTRLHVRCRLAP